MKGRDSMTNTEASEIILVDGDVHGRHTGAEYARRYADEIAAHISVTDEWALAVAQDSDHDDYHDALDKVLTTPITIDGVRYNVEWDTHVIATVAE